MLRKIHKEMIQPVQDSKQHIQAVIDCMESILKEVEVGGLRKALVYIHTTMDPLSEYFLDSTKLILICLSQALQQQQWLQECLTYENSTISRGTSEGNSWMAQPDWNSLSMDNQIHEMRPRLPSNSTLNHLLNQHPSFKARLTSSPSTPHLHVWTHAERGTYCKALLQGEKMY